MERNYLSRLRIRDWMLGSLSSSANCSHHTFVQPKFIYAIKVGGEWMRIFMNFPWNSCWINELCKWTGMFHVSSVAAAKKSWSKQASMWMGKIIACYLLAPSSGVATNVTLMPDSGNQLPCERALDGKILDSCLMNLRHDDPVNSPPKDKNVYINSKIKHRKESINTQFRSQRIYLGCSKREIE